MKSPYLLEQKVHRALYLLGCPRPPCQKCMFRQQEHTQVAGEYESTLEIFPSWVSSNLAKAGILFFLWGSFSYHQLLMQISQQCAVMQNTCDLQELEREGERLSFLKRPTRGSKSKQCGGR